MKILRNERQTPAGKLADAELEFRRGAVGWAEAEWDFAIWRRRDGRGCSVTFPARPRNVHGDNKNFALLRAMNNPKAQDQVRELKFSPGRTPTTTARPRRRLVDIVRSTPMIVKILPNPEGRPTGKLADAELHFTDWSAPMA